MRLTIPALAVFLVGCGYPGEPLPPALNRPVRASDLTAVQRGSMISVHFTVPEETTENLPLRGAPDIELRIGPLPEGGFTFPKWESASERVPATEIYTVEVQPPVPAAKKSAGKKTAEKKKSEKKKRSAPPIAPRLQVSAQFDASKLYGKTVVIGVRVHGTHGQDIGWSRLETLLLVPALPVPSGLVAADAPDAIRLEWHAAAPEFRVFRKIAGDAAFKQIGASDKPLYTDSSIEYGKSYEYVVQSVEKSGERYAESDSSESIVWKPSDKFPPAVPAGLTAVPGSKTIELVWDRNVEKDLASYQVYRDGKKVAEGLSSPAYSDRDVKAGTAYKYQVAAVDSAGNVSALCTAVEAAIP